MMPKPPHWMSRRMHAWPSRVKSRGVSSTVRPVTQTALTEVKAASTSEMAPLVVAQGSCRSREPSRHRPRKVLMSTRAGWLSRGSHQCSRKSPADPGRGSRARGARLAAMAAGAASPTCRASAPPAPATSNSATQAIRCRPVRARVAQQRTWAWARSRAASRAVSPAARWRGLSTRAVSATGRSVHNPPRAQRRRCSCGLASGPRSGCGRKPRRKLVAWMSATPPARALSGSRTSTGRTTRAEAARATRAAPLAAVAFRTSSRAAASRQSATAAAPSSRQPAGCPCVTPAQASRKGQGASTRSAPAGAAPARDEREPAGEAVTAAAFRSADWQAGFRDRRAWYTPGMGRAGNHCPAAAGGPEHSGGDHTPGRPLSATGDPLACGRCQGFCPGLLA